MSGIKKDWIVSRTIMIDEKQLKELMRRREKDHISLYRQINEAISEYLKKGD